MRRISASSVNRASWSKSMAMVLNEGVAYAPSAMPSNPQADIDVVLADPQTKRILLGECTWRNSFNETEAVEALLGREGLIPGYDDTRFMVFSKHPMSNATRDRYAGKVDFVTAEELYRR